MGFFRPMCDVSVARTTVRIFCICLIFCAGAFEVPAQSRAGVSVDIEGPLSVAAGDEALLSASVNQAAAQAMESGAFLEWLINGVPRNTGNALRCRSRTPATYRITLNLISETTGRRVVIARDQHTLTFVETPPTPPPTTARETSLRWVLTNKRDWIDEIRVPEMQTSVQLIGNEYVGISSIRCVGTAESKVRWNELPEKLQPGASVMIELQQELNLSADPDPDCDPPQVPRASANAKFFVLTEARHERTIDTIAETARSKTDRFSKSKLVQWRAPSGRVRDEMTIEIGGESPAGSASRFYTYELRSVETAKPAPPPRPAPTPAPAPAPKPSPEPVAAPPPTPVPTPVPAAVPPPPAPVIAKRVTALSVKLDTPSKEIPLGATARVHASVTGGRPPYRLFWSIRGIAAEQDVDTLTLPLTRAGAHNVEVRVSDADGKTVRDEIHLVAEPPAVRLTKRSPAGDRLFVEEIAVFECELYTKYAAAPGDFIFRWRSDAAISFDPPEGPQTQTRAEFLRPGRTEVWAEVLYRVEDSRYEPVSRSEPIQIQVVPPEVSITFSTARPLVGQQVRALVVTKPPLGEAEYRWDAVPPNAMIVSRSADFRELRFILKDEAPADFKVAAILSRFGEPAGDAVARVAARKYRVEIKGPERTDVLPNIWKQGIGLVPLEDRLAVGQPLALRADLFPAPPDPSLVYEWRSETRAGAIRDSSSRTPVVVCSATGRYTFAVVVRDANGIELGNAQTSIDVTVTAKEVEDAQRQAKAHDLREQGFELLRQDKVPEAMALYRESMVVWPSEEVRKHLEQLERQLSQQELIRARVKGLHAEGDQLAKQGDWDGAAVRYRESLGLLSDPKVESQLAQVEQQIAARTKKQADARALQAEGRNLEDQGKFREALNAYNRSLENWPDKDLQARIETLQKRISTEDEQRARATAFKKEGEDLEKEKQFEEASDRYRKSLNAWPDSELQKRLWTLENEIARRAQVQKRAEALKAEATELLAAKQYDEAIARYRRSVQLVPDPELEAQAQQLQAALDNRRARQADAQRFREEGERLEAAGNLREAIARYKSSLEAWTTDGIEARVQELEKKLEKQEADLVRAEALEREGTELERSGRIEQAIAKFGESIALHANPSLESRITALRGTLRQQERDRQTSARLRREGEALEKEGQLDAALLKYRESLRAWPDDRLAESAKALELQTKEMASARVTADRLREEASVLLLQGNLDDAAAKLRESLPLHHDPAVEAHVARIEEQARQQKAEAARAQKLVEDGLEFERAGKLEEAAARYRDSLSIQSDAEVTKRLSKVETLIREETARRQATAVAKKTQQAAAQKFRIEGEKLEGEGRLLEAIAKYRAGLDLWPDAETEKRIASLQKTITEQEQIGARAQQFEREGMELERAGQLERAVAKFTESLALQTNALVEARIASLRETLRRQEAERQSALRLRLEAQILEKNGDFEAALEKYRESLRIQPDKELAAHADSLEQRMKELIGARALAEGLRDEGSVLLLQGRMEDAIEKFKESLATHPNEQLERHVRNLEGEAARIASARVDAAELAREAAEHEAAGRLKEALTAYRQSLTLYPDDQTRDRIAELEVRSQEEERGRVRAAARRTREFNARKLREEGEKLHRAGKATEAVVKFRASLDIVPNEPLQAKVAEIEQQLAEEEEQRQTLTRLREEAQALLLDQRTEEAIAKYRESLAIQPDESLANHVLRLEEQHRKEQADIAAALRMKNEGFALENEGRLEEASARLRESLALRSDPDVRAHLAKVEARLKEHASSRDSASAAMRARQTAAQRLRTDGERLEEAGQLREAIAKYRGSLDVWPDSELEAQIDSLEKTLASREESLHLAQQLEQEGATFERDGKVEEAVEKYRASLKASPNEVLENRLVALQKQLSEQEKRRVQEMEAADQAAEWARQAGELEEKGELEEAAAAYRRSLNLREDKAVQEQLQQLERAVVAREGKRMTAARLREEAHLLKTQDKLQEAIEKYRESLSFWPDKRIEKHTQDLEAQLARQIGDRDLATRLRKEAETLEQDGKLEEALAKYRESLGFMSDPSTDAVVADLQARLLRKNADIETADRLWKEGILLVRGGKRSEGLVLLKQSLEFHGPSDRAGAVRDIERQMAALQQESPPPLAIPSIASLAPQPTPAKPADGIRQATPVAVARTTPPPVPEKQSRPSPPQVAEPRPDTRGTRWKGVILLGTGPDTLQWPLRVTIAQANNISASYTEHDTSGRPVEFTVGGVFDPPSGTLYMAVQRKGPSEIYKATLIGTMQSKDAAGGQVSLSTSDSLSEPRKGIWRLMREH